MLSSRDAKIVQLWLEKQPSPHTRYCYRLDSERLLNLAGKPLSRITLADLQSFAQFLASLGLASISRARSLAAVKSLFGFCHRVRYLPVNPAAELTLPGYENRLAERILGEEEVQWMLAAETDLRNRVLLRLLYAAGLRVSEACSLRWRMVKYECPVQEIRKTPKGVRIVYAERGSMRSLEASYCICTMPLSVLKSTKHDLSSRVVAALNQLTYAEGYKIAWESRRFWEQENKIYGGISWLGTGPISVQSSRLANVWYPSNGMFSAKGILISGYGVESGEFAQLPSLQAKFAASRGAVEKLHPGRGKELSKPLYVAWAKIPFSLGSWVRS